VDIAHGPPVTLATAVGKVVAANRLGVVGEAVSQV